MTRDNVDLTSRITKDPAILAGKPTIKGTRVAVEMVLEYFEDTPNLDEFFADYPELTLADVQACLGYAKKLVQAKAPSRAGHQPRSAAPADS